MRQLRLKLASDATLLLLTLLGVIACFRCSLCDISATPHEHTMSYIGKLALKRPQKLQVTKFVKEIKQQQEKLRARYTKEEYAQQTTDEKLVTAKTLLGTNIPAAAVLLKGLMGDKLSLNQKIVCLHHLYVAYMALGPLSEGLKFAEEQYHLSKSSTESGDWDDVSSSEIQQLQFQAACDVGNAHCFLGNLKQAKIFLDEAKKIASEMADQERITLATIYHGNWLLASGQLKIAMTEVFRPLMRETLSDSSRGLMLQGFGNACRSAADWGPAKDYLRESIAIAEGLNDTVAVADRQGDLGTVYRSEGRTADALEYQQKHYEFAKKRGDRAGLCVACFNLGFTYYSSKPPQLNSAVVYHTIQLEMSHVIGLPGMKSRALNCLGKVFTSLSNFDGAIQLFNECVDLHSRTGNVAGLGMAYGNLGTAYRALAQYDDAVVFHEKYRDNAKERDDVGGVAIMQREIALDYMFKGDYEMAENSIKEALITLEEIRMKLGPEDTSRIANYEKNQAEAYNFLQTILVKRDKTKEALALSERGRARALADIIRSKLLESEKENQGTTKEKMAGSDKGDAKIDELRVDEVLAEAEDATNILKLAKKLNTTLLIYSIVSEFSEQSNSSKWVYIWVVTMATSDPTEEPSVHFAKRQLTRKEQDNVSSAIDNQYVNSLCRSLGNLNVNDNQDDTSSCDQQEVEDLESDCTKETRRDSGMSYRRPQSQDQISTSLDVQEILQDKDLPMSKKKEHSVDAEKKKTDSDPERQRAFQKLRADYDMFIAPIEDYLPKVRYGEKDIPPRITIIPQDFLFNLPFCALLCPDGKHLVEKYIISFAPSIQVLQLTYHRLNMLHQQNTKAPPSVLAVGNPTMPHPKIVPLPAANNEVKMVRSHFNNDSDWPIEGSGRTPSMVAMGTDATVDFVRKHMGKHDVLHFATHAEQDEGIAEMIRDGLDHCPSKPAQRGDFSMRGFLVLARSNESCSGLLSAEEIKAQHLKAEVAVLSCCQTGMGQVTGDGVLGLYRSFLAAGAASVVVTHWKIYDRATAKFMRHFYRAFQVHRDPAQALRIAMLRMLHDKRHHGPQYWAAFAVIGASAIIGTD